MSISSGGELKKAARMTKIGILRRPSPDHHGHLILGRQRAKTWPRPLIFVPAALSPFKKRRAQAAKRDCRWLRAAIEGQDGFFG